MKRGDVVIVKFPYADGSRGKSRPSLVVQNDRDNARFANTIVAMISGNIRFAAEPTQLLVDPATAAGASSGLHGASVVKCGNLSTVRQEDVQQVIGHLSDQLMSQVNERLNAALEIP
jgi:mRNA-degrading endonuclease toxin of MazEF toxin-antitoxin module